MHSNSYFTSCLSLIALCSDISFAAQQEEGNRTAPLIAHPVDDPDQGMLTNTDHCTGFIILL